MTDTERLRWLMERRRTVHVSLVFGKWVVFFHTSPITEPCDTYEEAIDQAASLTAVQFLDRLPK